MEECLPEKYVHIVKDTFEEARTQVTTSVAVIEWAASVVLTEFLPVRFYIECDFVQGQGRRHGVQHQRERWKGSSMNGESNGRAGIED